MQLPTPKSLLRSETSIIADQDIEVVKLASAALRKTLTSKGAKVCIASSCTWHHVNKLRKSKYLKQEFGEMKSSGWVYYYTVYSDIAGYKYSLYVNVYPYNTMKRFYQISAIICFLIISVLMYIY